jgi:hypothetical protein
MTTKIFSGFPGVGKSYYFFVNDGLTKADSDSSMFSKLPNGDLNPNFISDYIKHIKSLIGTKGILLVSSHNLVRDAMVEAGIEFTLVYPDRSLRDEYLDRFRERSSSDSFIGLVDSEWDSFIDSCIGQKNCKHIVLKAGEYVSDVIGGIANE